MLLQSVCSSQLCFLEASFYRQPQFSCPEAKISIASLASAHLSAVMGAGHAESPGLASKTAFSPIKTVKTALFVTNFILLVLGFFSVLRGRLRR